MTSRTLLRCNEQTQQMNYAFFLQASSGNADEFASAYANNHALDENYMELHNKKQTISLINCLDVDILHLK